MRLRPPALDRPCGFAQLTGPPDLRLATHAAATSGPRSPVRIRTTDRASGSAPRGRRSRLRPVGEEREHVGASEYADRMTPFEHEYRRHLLEARHDLRHGLADADHGHRNAH